MKGVGWGWGCGAYREGVRGQEMTAKEENRTERVALLHGGGHC